MMYENFNLIRQYDFYNKYHKNSINRNIHIICIPMLVRSGSVFFSYINFNIIITPNMLLYQSYLPYLSYLSYLSYLFFGIVKFNGASIMATTYTSYYLILNRELGIIMYFILYFIQISSYYFYLYISAAWIYAVVLHISSWIAQIVGHVVFEKNMPAFKDSLIQSFLTAPIFVLMEVIDY